MPDTKKYKVKTLSSFWIFLVVTVLLITSGKCAKNGTTAPLNTDTLTDQPALDGRLIFHSYSCYSCNDSRLLMYDFKKKSLTVLSSDAWGIKNPMNAHFSPDGSTIVFMGITTAGGWDIFRWKIGSSDLPKNLTVSFGNTRDEDPKYSFDGSKIVFKQNGVMKMIDTRGNILNTFVVPNSETSMPYFAKGDSILLYSGNETSGSTTDIYKLSLNNSSVQVLSGNSGVSEYYPVTKNDSSFLFARWVSSTDHHDQIYLGFLNGKTPQNLSFNETTADFSDPFPATERYIFVSSTKTGGYGGYDLYIADAVTGKKWSLSLYYGYINTSKEELGACYTQ